MLGLSQFRRNCAAQNTVLPPEPAPPNEARIFVLVPHCDDETLGCGGFISAARARGLAVQVAFATSGDGSRSMQIAETMRHRRLRNFPELAALRQGEARAACAELGVEESDVLFFGYPDGGLGALWNRCWHAPFRSPFTRASSVLYADAQTPGAPYCGAALLNDVRAALDRFRPTLLITTHPADTHSDHWACWAFAQSALESLQLNNCDWARATEVRAFPVHRGVWPAPHGYHPTKKLAPPADLLAPARRWTSWELNDNARAAKKRALAQHDSQMAWTPLYLRGFLRRNEIFETIARADENFNENSDENDAARGVSLLALDDETATLRIKLHAGRGTIRLFLRAVAGEETRAWNVEIHASRTKYGVARARELAVAPSEFHNWPAAPLGTGFDIAVPLAALSPRASNETRDFSLFVSASVQMQRRTNREDKSASKGRTHESTEIGVVQIANVQAEFSPLVISRLDPRTAKVGVAHI